MCKLHCVSWFDLTLYGNELADNLFVVLLSPADLEFLCIQMEGWKGCLLILQLTLSCTRAGQEFKMTFINWRGVKEVGAEINMDLRTENRHSMGKCLFGNSAAEKANALRIISWSVFCKH